MHNWIVVSTVFSLVGLAFVFAVLGFSGPDPVKWLLHQSGNWALAFLVATLSVSTLARAFRHPQLVLWRRPIGLAAFFLATLHAFVYVVLYQGVELYVTATDIAKRPYITLGFFAWILLIPLAATSARASRRRMGKSWVRLHQAVYVIVPLGVLHQSLAQKSDLSDTIIFSAFVAWFLTERVVRFAK